jgi:hypothetical protein
VEDLWKLREIGYRLNDLADRAEYDRLLRRFREEEEKINRDSLLYGQSPFGRPKND